LLIFQTCFQQRKTSKVNARTDIKKFEFGKPNNIMVDARGDEREDSTSSLNICELDPFILIENDIKEFKNKERNILKINIHKS